MCGLILNRIAFNLIRLFLNAAWGQQGTRSLKPEKDMDTAHLAERLNRSNAHWVSALAHLYSLLPTDSFAGIGATIMGSINNVVFFNDWS